MNAPLGVNVAANTGDHRRSACCWRRSRCCSGARRPGHRVDAEHLADRVRLVLGAVPPRRRAHPRRHSRRSPSRRRVLRLRARHVAHANGHLNFTAQFVLPILIWRLVRLTRVAALRAHDVAHRGPRRCRSSACSRPCSTRIAAELLFFTGIAAVHLRARLVDAPPPRRRPDRPRVHRGRLGHRRLSSRSPSSPTRCGCSSSDRRPITAPGSVTSTRPRTSLSFGALSARSVGGVLRRWTPLTVNLVEENSYFGPVLLVVVVLCAVIGCVADLGPRSVPAARTRRSHGRCAATAGGHRGAVARVAAADRSVDDAVPLPWALVAPPAVLRLGAARTVRAAADADRRVRAWRSTRGPDAAGPVAVLGSRRGGCLDRPVAVAVLALLPIVPTADPDRATVAGATVHHVRRLARLPARRPYRGVGAADDVRDAGRAAVADRRPTSRSRSTAATSSARGRPGAAALGPVGGTDGRAVQDGRGDRRDPGDHGCGPGGGRRGPRVLAGRADRAPWIRSDPAPASATGYGGSMDRASRRVADRGTELFGAPTARRRRGVMGS